MKSLLKSRYSLYISLLLLYVSLSFVIRLVLFILSNKGMELSFLATIKIFSIGLYFDVATAFFLFAFYSLYILVIPTKWVGGRIDKGLTYIITTLSLFVVVFSFIAEFPFWEEFNTRFNFIAVDYLIYTYEVIENINQSYSIPFILIVLFSIIAAVSYLFKKKHIYENTFSNNPSIAKRLFVFALTSSALFFFSYFTTNKQAEWSSNLYENELSKNGVFSFFAAYRSNELDYNTFYMRLTDKQAFDIVKKEILQENQTYDSQNDFDLSRHVVGGDEIRPNIILICIESFSADFLGAFGNQQNITPTFDTLAQHSIFLSNLYATGTRTVRGMEALTLCVPPTPGNSIVRRPNNDHLFSIASILRKKEYALSFIYGGDGYFDNMNTYFGGQGYTIIDRDRGNPLSEEIQTTRIPISDKDVTFENAWGICDEDLYRQSLIDADKNVKKNKPFFQFIMTTSNHKPYSFPENKIDLPQGNRESAVKYTDYAVGEFLKAAMKKSWYNNTVFVFIADHCASSAGKWEVNIQKHHIPAIIYNLPQQDTVISTLASQIDLMPTLFGYLGWTYETELFGKDINHIKSGEERSLLGNYRTIGILRDNIYTEINDRKKAYQYSWDAKNSQMVKFKNIKNEQLKNICVSYYQTASYLYKNNLMKENKKIN
ncbi:MAG: sulfatase-like hydrolase/transferase [Bacteroidetes bacterium]|nr:sulfatase-like hydrolase/transferase [Bacteroidota bacterium]